MTNPASNHCANHHANLAHANNVRTRALISAAALRHNLALLRERTGTPLLVPTKANAYGHGIAEVAGLLAHTPEVWGLAAATPAEALEICDLLEQAGANKAVLLFGASLPEEWPELVRRGVRLTVFTAEDAARLPAGAKVHLKVDTGMNRLGAKPPEAARVGRLLQQRGLLEGVYTHFTDAEASDQSRTRAQAEAFAAVAGALHARQPSLLRHAGNSAAALRGRGLHGLVTDLARPGMAVYGPPNESEAALEAGLRAALTLQTRVMCLHTAAAGERVSYNGLVQLEHDTLLATLPVGYADGYPRSMTGRAEVLIAGQRRPVLGRICMDQIMVDATGLAVKVGDWVTLLGGQVPAVSGDAAPTLADWVRWSASAPADRLNTREILTSLGRRVMRMVVD